VPIPQQDETFQKCFLPMAAFKVKASETGRYSKISQGLYLNFARDEGCDFV
jgi:hypothetical protein